MHKSKHKHINSTAIITLSLLFITVLSVIALSSPISFADTSATTTTSVTVSSACSITANNTIPHTTTILPGHEDTEIGNTTMTVECNDASGSAVYAVGFSNDTWKNTNLIDTSTNNTIPTGTGTSSSNWSMKLSVPTGNTAPTIRNDATYNFTNYEVVPNDYALVATFPSASDGTNNSTFNTTYRAYVGASQAPGAYTGKVKYTLVHPSNAAAPTAGPKTIANATTMQEVEACPNTITAGQIYSIVDSRDGTSYRVARLADGNCWMLDNLALDITTVSLDTLKGNTNATDTTLEYLKGTHVRGDGYVAQDTNYPTGAVDKAWTSDAKDYYSVPMIAVDSTTSGPCLNAYCVNSDKSWSSASVTPVTIDDRTSVAQGKIGIYYNYCAASAGSYCYGSGTDYTGSPTSDPDTSTPQDVKEDICPKGWRLPTGLTYGEFKSLYTAYNSNYTDFETALSTPLSGYFYSGLARTQGGGGWFWSSSWYDTYDMLYLSVGSSAVWPYSWGNRYNGGSVRCISAE